jgi:hypothetical protein
MGMLGHSVEAAVVNFELIDDETGKTTPAMACITGTSSGDVHLPPDGRVCTQPSETEAFYRGIEYSTDRSWIGPVRKTKGRGNNNDRSFVYELKPSLPYWDEPVMFQVQSRFSIELPPGKWRVAIERGMEFVPVVDEFEIKPEDTSLDKTIRLQRWINLSRLGWWSGDVHVHHPMLKPEHQQYLLQYAIAEDLHVVNILEMGHHKGTDFKQEGFGKAYRVNQGNYWLVPGQEEPRSTFGHIIGLNLDELARVEDIRDYDFYDINFRKIQAQPDALVGFAHMAWNGCALPRGMPWYVTTGQIDFVEILQMTHLNAMGYYDYLNLGFKLTAAAGSDVPWGSTIGEVRTYAYTGKRLDIDQWFEALQRGNTFVSNGPAVMFTVDGKLPGTEIKAGKGQELRIRAVAKGHPKVGLPRALTVVNNAGVVREVFEEQGSTSLSLNFEFPIERSQWITVSVVCDNNAVAHTSPVYVVVDDQPTWCPKRGPIVIENQLKEIAKIESEFHRNAGYHGQGVHERLDKAKAFYADLRRKMLASQQTNTN